MFSGISPYPRKITKSSTKGVNNLKKKAKNLKNRFSRSNHCMFGEKYIIKGFPIQNLSDSIPSMPPMFAWVRSRGRTGAFSQS